MLTCQRIFTVVVLALSLTSVSFANSSVYKQLVKSTAMIVTADGHGSGALIDADRKLVFTNYHVVGEADEVSVVFPRYENGELVTNRSVVLREIDRFAVSGKVVARDMKRDLVLIEVASIPDGIEAAKLAEVAASPGETIHAIGNPGAVDAMWVYTSGKVRQLFRTEYTLSEGTQPVDTRVVETDLAINPGDSGGPVVNDQGEVVAVVSAFSTKSRLVSSCIDARELKALLDGDNSTIDSNIAKALDDAGLEYTTNAYGVFFIQVPAYDDVKIEVRIGAIVHEHRGRKLRHLRALFLSQEEEFSGTAALKLMYKNSERKFGGWEFAAVDGINSIFYRADLNIDADADELIAALKGVADSTRALVVELQNDSNEEKVDSEPTAQVSTNDIEQLIGIWNGEREENGVTVGYAIRFDADGTIHWFLAKPEQEVISADGKFTFDGDMLSFDLNGDDIRAKLEIVDDKNLVYTDEGMTLRLSRFEQTTEAAPIDGVAGTWTSTVNSNGKNITYTLSFTDDGNIKWNVTDGANQLLSIDGNYKIEDGKLTYTSAGNTYTAEVSLDGDRMIFKDPANTLTLTRSNS